MPADDVGQLSLLEWSQELDRSLLHIPFRPIRTTAGSNDSLVLYKLAYSAVNAQLGLLLLDCDACAAYYEGVTIRTLDRRTHFGASSSSSSTMHANLDARLAAMVSAIHQALDPNTSPDPASQVAIDLDFTRFSCSLAISNAASQTDDTDDRPFKTSFDLDPLDHASRTQLLSSHLIRPLLALATALARSPSRQQLGIISCNPSASLHCLASSRSLRLIRETALERARLPSDLLDFPSLPTSFEDSSLASVPKGHSESCQTQSNRTELPPSPPKSSKQDTLLNSVLDAAHDMTFFGPPGAKPPRISPNRAGPAREPELALSPSSNSGDDQVDQDTTLSAIAIPRPAHTLEAPQPPSRTTVLSQPIPKVKTESHTEDSGSETSQEEDSLPLRRILPKESRHSPSLRPNTTQAPQGRSASAETIHTDLSLVRQGEAQAGTAPEALPDASGSASLFAPTPSQSSAFHKDALRDEQLRRREQIARIKRGLNGGALSASTPVNDSQQAPCKGNRSGSISAPSSRKRSRF